MSSEEDRRSEESSEKSCFSESEHSDAIKIVECAVEVDQDEPLAGIEEEFESTSGHEDSSMWTTSSGPLC